MSETLRPTAGLTAVQYAAAAHTIGIMFVHHGDICQQSETASLARRFHSRE